jgi:hypothetical protein
MCVCSAVRVRNDQHRLYRAQIVSELNSIDSKLYIKQILGGANCIGYKLWRFSWWKLEKGWFIEKQQAFFLAIVWFGFSFSPSPCKLTLFLWLPLCRRSGLLTNEMGGEEWERSQIIRLRSWSSINHSILSGGGGCWGGSVSESILYRARIFKCLWGPGIDSKEWIPPAYVAWRAGTLTLFLLGS